MKLDIEQLQTFYMVAQKQSFTRAAEALFLTQSAVSKRVLTLEQALDKTLFDRIGHKVQLTSAGLILMPSVQRILAEIENSQQLIQNLGKVVSGPLKIATSHHIGLHRLPQILKQFTQQFPEVNLSIQFVDSEQACRGIAQGDPELGIVTLPLKPLSNLKVIPIWNDHLEPVVSRSHELAALKRVSLNQLSRHNAILPATGTFTRTILEDALEPLGIDLKSGMSTNYLETIKMMVSVGLGWSILPRSMHDKELKILKIPELSLQRTLGIVMHTNRTLSNAANALIKLVQSTATSSRPN